MNYQLVIFDWDGTLMDSTDRIVACMHRASVDLVLPLLPAAAVKQIIGLGLPEAISTLYPELGASDLSAMRDRYAEPFIAAEAVPCNLYAGALELVDQVRLPGPKLAVATGKSRKGLDRVWQSSQLGDYFHSSRCSDEGGSKPHPAMLHEIVAELGLSVEDAIMIGDTSFDLEMAERAGMDRIGVTYGAHAAEQLAQYQPLALCDSLTSILPHLYSPKRERI